MLDQFNHDIADLINKRDLTKGCTNDEVALPLFNSRVKSVLELYVALTYAVTPPFDRFDLIVDRPTAMMGPCRLFLAFVLKQGSLAC